MAITGIDVSRHQGDGIDYNAVRRAGHSFAFIKATEGTSYAYTGWYRANAPRVQAAGLVLGAYHFLRTGDGAAQARYFISVVGQLPDGVAILDVETAANGSKPTISDVREFVGEYRRRVPNDPLLIYTGRWYWVGVMGDPRGSDLGPLWHSEYETSQAEVADGPEADRYGGWDGCTVWQWTSSGSTPGVPGRVDLNILRKGTLPNLIGTTKELDMAIDKADVLTIADTVWLNPVNPVGGGDPGPAEAHLRWANYNAGKAVALLGQLAQKLDVALDVDEAAIVQGVLAGLQPAAIAEAVAAALPAEQAKLVADELASRLAD